MKYEISGKILDSNIELPELIFSSSSKKGINFSLLERSIPSNEDYKLLRNVPLPNGKIWMSIAKKATNYILTFPDVANFIILKESNNILCYCNKKISNSTIRYILLNQVMPLYLSSLGLFVIHCSAVCIKDRAILFLGNTRMGKSTIASMLCNFGYDLITDDFLVLKNINNEIVAIPSYPTLRLNTESIINTFNSDLNTFEIDGFLDKKWIKAEGNNISFCKSQVLVDRMFILENSIIHSSEPDIQLSNISLHEAFNALLNNCFILDIKDLSILKTNFLFSTNVLKKIIIKKLKYKKEFSSLSKIKDTILQDIEV